MSSRIIGSTQLFAQTRIQSIEWAAFARMAAKGFLTTAHRALLVLGVSAITALCMMFFKPNLIGRLKALSPVAETVRPETVLAVAPPLTNGAEARVKPLAIRESASSGTLMDEDLKGIGTNRQQRWVTNWLSKRYHVAGDATNMLVSASYLAAQETKLDPLLILAVMSIESRLNPFAESAMGAQGLMQVMSNAHRDKFEELGGVKAALNPVANIKVGSLILKDYVTRGGSVEAGLKLYVGAGAFEKNVGYGAKVLAEYRHLKEVAIGKNVAAFSTRIGIAALKQRRLIDRASDGKPTVEIEPDSTALQRKQVDAKVAQFAAL